MLFIYCNISLLLYPFHQPTKRQLMFTKSYYKDYIGKSINLIHPHQITINWGNSDELILIKCIGPPFKTTQNSTQLCSTSVETWRYLTMTINHFPMHNEQTRGTKEQIPQQKRQGLHHNLHHHRHHPPSPL